MKVRFSQTLVFTCEGGDFLACNYLTKNTFVCSSELLHLLETGSGWLDADVIGDPQTIQELLKHDVLVAENSDLAKREAEFKGAWRWGLPTALMHFCVQDADYVTIEESERQQVERASAVPQPELFMRNCPGAIRLPDAMGNNDLLQLMARRRTNRTAAAPTITLNQLSDCLFAGLGITGETTNCVGSLPLGMTPSGGARNPYEAFVISRRVEGLDPGVYHYSAADHDLGRLTTNELPELSDLVGGQDWADEMPCLVLLSASLDRTMWKYADANAYRVVLIEAGHIGQNIMLAATQQGLSACPTAALNHSAIKRLLGQDRLTDAPIYALTIARPGAEKPIQTRINSQH